MTFVNERGAISGEAIPVESMRVHRHEQHGIRAPQAEVHTTSQASALTATHFKIGDEFFGHGCLNRSSKYSKVLWVLLIKGLQAHAKKSRRIITGENLTSKSPGAVDMYREG
jgi:hypothetical protein